MIFIRTIFPFFPFCSKNEKIEKWHTYRLIFHNSILTRKMKKMTSVANNFSIFSINRKQTNKQKRIIFLMKNSKEKWQIMNIYQQRKEKPNPLQTHQFCQTIYTGSAETWDGEGGFGPFSSRNANVVSFTFGFDQLIPSLPHYLGLTL